MMLQSSSDVFNNISVNTYDAYQIKLICPSKPVEQTNKRINSNNANFFRAKYWQVMYKTFLKEKKIVKEQRGGRTCRCQNR